MRRRGLLRCLDPTGGSPINPPKTCCLLRARMHRYTRSRNNSRAQSSMTDPSIAVQVTELRKRYGGGLFGRAVEALRGVSFEVPKGQIFGLLGPNGAGKTTIIKVLLGIVRPSGGTATFAGACGGRPSRATAGRLSAREPADSKTPECQDSTPIFRSAERYGVRPDPRPR